VQQVAGRLVEERILPGLPTFFECATAIAFELFRRRGVTIAVLEVGLGGRLDATNIVTPIAAVITSIDFDHQAQLGDDLTSIAREKAGIIKPGIPVVCGPLPPAADLVMAETCLEQGARLIRARDRVTVSSRTEDGDTIASLTTAAHTIGEVRLGLRGQHQITNAAVALCLLEELDALGIEATDPAIADALAHVRWPARLERLTWHGADVLLDAAHNPAGARALASYLNEIGWSGTPVATLVVGAMKDKDVAGILGPLLTRFARVICTTANSPRALGATELAELARTVSPGPAAIEAIDDPSAALRSACRPGARVVVAGSIFLVGPLRGILR
jgi:dihydrofolate synthase/folylpolyglutamate synthase